MGRPTTPSQTKPDIGEDVFDTTGKRVGKVGHVYNAVPDSHYVVLVDELDAEQHDVKVVDLHEDPNDPMVITGHRTELA